MFYCACAVHMQTPLHVSSTLCWLRCRLSYSLLRSSIQAIRGARSSQGHAVKSPTAIDHITKESHITVNDQLFISYLFLKVLFYTYIL